MGISSGESINTVKERREERLAEVARVLSEAFPPLASGEARFIVRYGKGGVFLTIPEYHGKLQKR